MGLLDVLRDNPEVFLLKQDLAQQQRELEQFRKDYADVEEDLLAIADRFDNIGWSPIGEDPRTFNELPLATVKKISEIGRALLTNPFVDMAVSARISYIWGGGVQFPSISDNITKKIKQNKRVLFSQQGYEERERAAATDGNVFTAISRADEPMFRVPLSQITGSISNPDNTEEIWYLKREWTVKKTKNGEEDVQEKNERRYYPTLEYAMRMEAEGKEMPKRWANIGVDQKFAIQHDAVNKQIGWRWGVPDIMPVIFFAKVYKEYLEDNADLVKAYSRIAYQVKAGSVGAANSAYASLTRTPVRNPLTGELSDVGGTAVTGPNTDLVATGLNSSAVDFDKGKALAAGIAAGMAVPLDVILGATATEGAAMPLATKRVMLARQNIWTNSFELLFEFWGDDDIEVAWGQIDEDETHRRVQSIHIGLEGGTLHREEARAEMLKTLGIVPLIEGLPDDPAEVAFERAQETAAAEAKAVGSVVPAQGRSGAVGSVNSGKGQVRQATKKSMANQSK